MITTLLAQVVLDTAEIIAGCRSMCAIPVLAVFSDWEMAIHPCSQGLRIHIHPLLKIYYIPIMIYNDIYIKTYIPTMVGFQIWIDVAEARDFSFIIDELMLGTWCGKGGTGGTMSLFSRM